DFIRVDSCRFVDDFPDLNWRHVNARDWAIDSPGDSRQPGPADGGGLLQTEGGGIRLGLRPLRRIDRQGRSDGTTRWRFGARRRARVPARGREYPWPDSGVACRTRNLHADGVG